MKIVLDFLNQLAENNNKEWFDANKSFYKEVKQTFEAFTEKLIINISEFETILTINKTKEPRRRRVCEGQISSAEKKK